MIVCPGGSAGLCESEHPSRQQYCYKLRIPYSRVNTVSGTCYAIPLTAEESEEARARRSAIEQHHALESHAAWDCDVEKCKY